MTILEVARQQGIRIPTLCYYEGLLPFGGCRLCVVEVDGSRPLVASCYTPITQNMVVKTNTPRVIEARQMVMELMLASHGGNCLVCDRANVCELRSIASELSVGLPPFKSRKRFYQKEEVSSQVERDLSKCVLCRRCIRACREIKKAGILGTGYRGFETKVTVDCDQSPKKDTCQDCDVCVTACPTGALNKKRALGEKKRGKPLVIRG